MNSETNLIRPPESKVAASGCISELAVYSRQVGPLTMRDHLDSYLGLYCKLPDISHRHSPLYDNNHAVNDIFSRVCFPVAIPESQLMHKTALSLQTPRESCIFTNKATATINY